MSQPTFEDLRAKGAGPAWAGRYAAPPGTGPAGMTCHDCKFLTYTHHTKAKHPKCGKTAYTHGDATTIKTRTAACRLFESPPGAAR